MFLKQNPPQTQRPHIILALSYKALKLADRKGERQDLEILQFSGLQTSMLTNPLTEFWKITSFHPKRNNNFLKPYFGFHAQASQSIKF